MNPEEDEAEFTLWLRIPAWTADRFIPGELYRYADGKKSDVTVKVNGRKVRADVRDGFMPVRRVWKQGDVVDLDMEMPVRYSVADERVEADINRMSVTRGPLLYCAEQPDNDYIASRYIISDTEGDEKLSTFGDGILEGIVSISFDASVYANDAVQDAVLTLIPYYAWNNRGDHTTMNVWFARDAETVVAAMPVLIPNVADVTATYTNPRDDVYAVADQKLPSHSSDKTIPRWTSWKQLGKTQQVTVTFKERQQVETVSVYWYDDDGGVRLPSSWTADYLVGDEWHTYVPYITDRFGVEKDQFNMVHPDSPVNADAIRINVVPRKGASVGILEVLIE